MPVCCTVGYDGYDAGTAAGTAAGGRPTGGGCGGADAGIASTSAVYAGGSP